MAFMNTDDLRKRIARFPRVTLAHAPTAIEPLAGLSALLGGDARIFVKRDDCTGLAMGGNKARQLEFYLGAAQAENADIVLITGAVQSNFARSAAAAARKCGFDCVVQLEERLQTDDATYHAGGNVLLDRLFGAEIRHYPEGEDEAGADAAIRAYAEELRSQGRRPYVIPLSADHPPLGALGYVLAAAELVEQMRNARQTFSEIIIGSGSGGSHAGLLWGLRALGDATQVIGACVRRDAAAQKARIECLMPRIDALLGATSGAAAEDVVTDDAALAPGYGRLSPEIADALCRTARADGLLLDPAYTAKVMATLLDRIKTGRARGDVLFIHTGGTPALFAYADLLADAI
ncbi:MAG: D-cysteine desulfhydrase [Parvularculaceae bacterium]